MFSGLTDNVRNLFGYKSSSAVQETQKIVDVSEAEVAKEHNKSIEKVDATISAMNKDKTFADKTADKVNAGVGGVKSGSATTWDKTKDAVDGTKTGTANAWDKTKEKAGNVKDAVLNSEKQTTYLAMDKAAESAKSAGKAVGKKANEGADAAKSGSNTAWEKTKEVAGNVKEGIAKSVESTLGVAMHSVINVAHCVKADGGDNVSCKGKSSVFTECETTKKAIESGFDAADEATVNTWHDIKSGADSILEESKDFPGVKDATKSSALQSSESDNAFQSGFESINESSNELIDAAPEQTIPHDDTKDSTWKKTKSFTVDATNSTAEAIESGYDSVVDGVSSVWDSAKQKTGSAWENTSRAIGSVFHDGTDNGKHVEDKSSAAIPSRREE